MDPNTALRDAREALEEFNIPDDERGGDVAGRDTAAQRLSEAFEALDWWLSNGGFLPDVWQRKPAAEAMTFPTPAVAARLLLPANWGHDPSSWLPLDGSDVPTADRESKDALYDSTVALMLASGRQDVDDFDEASAAAAVDAYMGDGESLRQIHDRLVAHFGAVLHVPADAWKPNSAIDDSLNSLLCTLIINGVSLHLEAWEVETRDGVQRAVNRGLVEQFAELHHAVHAVGPFQTTTINGREYVVFATPYC